MSDQLRPVFPPDETNLSREAIEAAGRLLDDETQRILALDRARLVQTTAATVLTLTGILGLSEGTATEVQQAIIRRAGEMSPNYHHYINQLLGNSALTLTTQFQSVGSRQDAIPSPQQLVVVHESSEMASVEVEPYTGSDQEVNEQAFDQADVLTFTPDIRFADHKKPNKHAIIFMVNVFGEDFPVSALSARETSLITHQLIATYMTTPIPQSSESRKANQKQRLEMLFALYGPARGSKDICEELGISTPSFYTGIKRVESSLASLMTPEKIEELVRRARTTTMFGVDEIFVPEDQIGETTQSDGEIKQQEGVEAKGSIEVGAKQEEISSAGEEAHTLEFKDHQSTPANMINFLVEVYPSKYGDRLHNLKPWKSSCLTYLLIEHYRDQLSRSSFAEKVRSEKILRLERWTGLYGNSQDFSEIATARATNAQAVKLDIEISINKIVKNMSVEELDQLFKQAATYAKPRTTERTTA